MSEAAEDAVVLTQRNTAKIIRKECLPRFSAKFRAFQKPENAPNTTGDR
jgi:hypothetical protein